MILRIILNYGRFLSFSINSNLLFERFAMKYQSIAASRLSSILFLFAMSTPAAANSAREAAENYLNGARAVVTELNQEQPRGEWIASKITEILDYAKPVTQAFANMHSQCKEQLDQLLLLYPTIESWSALEIRRNIEAGLALPAAEGCYPARDIIAHPAIVRSIAINGIQESQKTRLIREMDEAIEHMEEIATDLITE